METDDRNVSTLVWVPTLITTAVTLLRLAGELNDWSPAFFSRAAGGGGALVGISWLALVFAVYFAVRLQNLGAAPEPAGSALKSALGALAVMVAGGFLFVFGVQKTMRPAILLGLVVMAASLWVMRGAWPAYWRVMMAYALWARIPVIIVMFFAIRGSWGTHYDVAPPTGDVWGADWFRKWFEIGLLPQLFIWIPVTVVLCGLVGVVVALARRGSKAASPAA
jgi:hypothetical protein